MREFVIMADVNVDVHHHGYAEKHGVAILPQYYHFNDGVIYGDEITLTEEQFYARLEKERAYSMGCNPERVRGIMEEALKKGQDIIVVMASSECSGSFNTVRMEAEELLEQYPEAKIHVSDSYLEANAAGLLVRMAVDYKEAGKGFEETVEMLERRKSKIDIFFVVDHLDYLVRGGRLSPLSGMVGNMLSIKPILHFEDGKIVALTKCRGKQNAKKTIMELLEQKKLDKHYFVGGHTANEAEGIAFSESVKEKFGVEVLSVDPISLIIGVHVGPGAFAVAYVEEDQ